MNCSKPKIPAYYYLQPAKNGDDETEEELYDSNGTLITSEYLNDVVAKSMSDKYIIEQSSSDIPQYTCKQCDKILHNTGHLIAHIVLHTGESPYVCSLCQRSFANSTRLKLHLKVHCIKKLHPGLTVTRVPKTPSAEHVHKTGSEPPTNPVSATLSPTESNENLTKEKIYPHMKQHLVETNIDQQATHQCGQCGDEFPKSSALQEHQGKCHGAIKVSSEVDLVPVNKQESFCFKKQIEANPILSGLLMKEIQEPPPVPSIVTVGLEPIKGIEELHRQDYSEDAKCNLELLQLGESNSDPEHHPEQTKIKEKPEDDTPASTAGGGGFIISSVATVDQQFLENLAQMELQTRTPDLLEPLMEETVADAASYSGQNPFSSTTCALCGKTFSEKFGLRQHMRIMHAETKPFKCPECKKCFAKEHSMLIHLRIHVSNRPFMCIICYKTFTRAAALNGHLSSHSHEMLKCFACNETMQNVQNYACHIEKNHPHFPEVLFQIRSEKSENERAKILRQLLLQSLSHDTEQTEENASSNECGPIVASQEAI